MWRLRIGVVVRDEYYLFSINNYVGRQIWEFDVEVGFFEEFVGMEQVCWNFLFNWLCFKISGDFLWCMQVSEVIDVFYCKYVLLVVLIF